MTGPIQSASAASYGMTSSRRLCPGDREKIHYFCAFIVPGNLMLALRWLQDGTRESPEEIARFAGQFISSGVQSFAGR